MDRKYYVAEALNSLTAKRWELCLATIFGRRRVTTSEDGTMFMREWRGKLYFMKYVPPNNQGNRSEPA